MKQLAVGEVFEALVSYQSAEYRVERGGVTYHLHVTANGEIVGGDRDADKTFYATIREEDEDEYFSNTQNTDREKEIGEIWACALSEEPDEISAIIRAEREEAALTQDPTYTMEDYYRKESRDDPDFMEIVEDLAAQANAWLAEQE